MILLKTMVGYVQANSYLVGCEKTCDAVLIDPGDEGDRLKTLVAETGLNLTAVVNTHGHIDHIGANHCFNVPLYIHDSDKEFLSDPNKNLSAYIGASYTSPPATKLLMHGDTITCGELVFNILHTPGHTPGCICLACDGVVFSGDTLFRESVGRTDFPYGDAQLIIESIGNVLMHLPDETEVYPGHGESTTIGWEKTHNFFLQRGI